MVASDIALATLVDYTKKDIWYMYKLPSDPTDTPPLSIKNLNDEIQDLPIVPRSDFQDPENALVAIVAEHEGTVLTTPFHSVPDLFVKDGNTVDIDFEITAKNTISNLAFAKVHRIPGFYSSATIFDTTCNTTVGIQVATAGNVTSILDHRADWNASGSGSYSMSDSLSASGKYTYYVCAITKSGIREESKYQVHIQGETTTSTNCVETNTCVTDGSGNSPEGLR